MKKRFQVIEVVRHVYRYEVEANSAKEAENNVRRGIFNNAREQDSKRRAYGAESSFDIDTTYTAKEIW